MSKFYIFLFSILLLIPLKANALTITDYESDDLVNYNKQYIPQEYINDNYIYTFNGNDIIIITNNNCRTQYATTYCTCYTYNTLNNIISNGYDCSTSTNSSRTINRDFISSDLIYNDRTINYYFNNKLVYLLVLIVGIVFALFLTKERSSL